MTEKYIIWERKFNDNQNTLDVPRPTCYADTVFMARKECVTRAKQVLGTNDIKLYKRPLWVGEEPTKEGNTLVYTFPGPDETSIDVFEAIEQKSGWFTTESKIVFGKHLYQVYFQRLPRANTYSSDAQWEHRPVVRPQGEMTNLLNDINGFNRETLHRTGDPDEGEN